MTIQTSPMQPASTKSNGLRRVAALSASALAVFLAGCAVTPVDSYVVGTPVVPSSAYYYGYSAPAPAPYYYAPGYYTGPYYGGYRARPRHLHPSPPPPPRFSGRDERPRWRGDRGPDRGWSRPDGPRPPGAGGPARPRPPEANQMRPPPGGQNRPPGGRGSGLKPGELDGQ